MRGGTLFIERDALIRHVHDLGDLRGLSESTHEQFERIDEQSSEEKELLDEMKVAVHAIHEDLERVDELLFSGEQ